MNCRRLVKTTLTLNSKVILSKFLTQSFRFIQDRHLAEVRTLQVKLEEQQEKSNTLSEVNGVLRDQLDKAVENNSSLVGDLKRLAGDWEKLNQELLDRVSWKV